MSALRASIILLTTLPLRPDGRGYYLAALRAWIQMTAGARLDILILELESIPQILFVVFEFVLDQELDKFVLETSLGMVLTLIANVSDDFVFL
jgi:hypothetical protein